MHVTIDGKTVPLTHTAGGYEAVTEINGEKFIVHATVTSMTPRAATPAKARFVNA